MSVPFPLAWAIDTLRAHPLRTALQAAALAVGVGGVLLAWGIAAAATAESQRLIDAAGADVLEVRFAGDGAPPDVADRIAAAAPANLAVATVVMREGASVATDDGAVPSAAVDVRAVSADYFRARRLLVARGRLIAPIEFARQAGVCVVGAALADEAGGLDATLWIDDRPHRIVGVLPPALRSGGVAEGAVPDHDQAVVVPMALASHDAQPEHITALVIRCDETPPARVRVQIERELQTDGVVVAPAQLITQGFAQRRLLARALAIGAGVVAVVGLLGIANGTLASVKEQVQETAVARALGADRWHVASRVLCECGLTTLAGAALGVGGAIVASLLLGDTIGDATAALLVPTRPAAVLLAAAVATLATAAIPAWIATRIEPTHGMA